MSLPFAPLVGILIGLVQALGVLAAVEAMFKARTPQGAVAWSISLICLPALSLPFYLVFGGRKFHGYVARRRESLEPLHALTDDVRNRQLSPDVRGLDDPDESLLAVERLARMPFTRKNSAHLLIDGDATFDAILEAIAGANDYVLAQFYIIHDDGLGRRFRDALLAARSRGVRVYLLHDSIGCHGLPSAYLKALRSAGVRLTAFGMGRRAHRFQINFRNHRKIVVVDGRHAFLGGHNVGDEYLGLDPDLSPWRDTHVAIEGPAALCVQHAFLEDWNAMSNEEIPVTWTPTETRRGHENVLVVPTGPADELDSCALLFTHLINRAKRRIWIVSPYFVPDDGVICALQLAALRGVDVRILLPARADHRLVYLASFACLEDTIPYGIRVFRYTSGFLHQKVVLVDDDLAGVGTANFDNRSFRLNFEITALFFKGTMPGAVREMLEVDFDRARESRLEEIQDRPLWFRAASRAANLAAPVL